MDTHLATGCSRLLSSALLLVVKHPRYCPRPQGSPSLNVWFFIAFDLVFLDRSKVQKSPFNIVQRANFCIFIRNYFSMIKYNPKSWFKHIISLKHSDTFTKLWKELIAIGLLALGIAYLEVNYVENTEPLKQLNAGVFFSWFCPFFIACF